MRKGYKVSRMQASDLLASCGSNPQENFYSLTQSQTSQVLACARSVGYKQPKNSNGSKARYFFEYLQRRANSKD